MCAYAKVQTLSGAWSCAHARARQRSCAATCKAVSKICARAHTRGHRAVCVRTCVVRASKVSAVTAQTRWPNTASVGARIRRAYAPSWMLSTTPSTDSKLVGSGCAFSTHTGSPTDTTTMMNTNNYRRTRAGLVNSPAETNGTQIYNVGREFQRRARAATKVWRGPRRGPASSHPFGRVSRRNNSCWSRRPQRPSNVPRKGRTYMLQPRQLFRHGCVFRCDATRRLHGAHRLTGSRRGALCSCVRSCVLFAFGLPAPMYPLQNAVSNRQHIPPP